MPEARKVVASVEVDKAGNRDREQTGEVDSTISCDGIDSQRVEVARLAADSRYTIMQNCNKMAYLCRPSHIQSLQSLAMEPGCSVTMQSMVVTDGQKNNQTYLLRTGDCV